VHVLRTNSLADSDNSCYKESENTPLSGRPSYHSKRDDLITGRRYLHPHNKHRFVAAKDILGLKLTSVEPLFCPGRQGRIKIFGGSRLYTVWGLYVPSFPLPSHRPFYPPLEIRVYHLEK